MTCDLDSRLLSGLTICEMQCAPGEGRGLAQAQGPGGRFKGASGIGGFDLGWPR